MSTTRVAKPDQYGVGLVHWVTMSGEMRTDEMLDMAFEIELTNRVEAKLVKLENSFPVIPVESSPKLFLFNMNNYSQHSESAEVADWQSQPR
jgi:hypothetical protein